MSNLNLTDEVASAKQELRAIKAQGLVTDPKDAVKIGNYNITLTGIPANNSDGSIGTADVNVVPKNSSVSSPMCQAWLYNISVPSGGSESAVFVARIADQKFRVFCPFISTSTTETYSVSVHISSLVELEVSRG